ncbi:protein kintoun isoform X2 [Neoarius graeffei]|nr:protein kintoun isoform X2 [Neoarius graeffei]
MAAGDKLAELNMTPDEINRFTKAMKDEKFRELFHEYAQELSNPENKKKYEEEITQLEQERGMEVKFIHPNAHHVLKTTVNGKEKCFINICSNNLINKPTCEAKRAENGQVGQCWSLPYSLTPGRPDRDNKGNNCMIYDVVFHPDTLYMADKNTRFMNLVNSTATQGVEDAFKVTLDKTKKLLKNIKYKGVPQSSVIRKPIPGQPRKEESSRHDEAFPIRYPDTTPTKDLKPLSSSLPQSPVKQSSLLPIQPHYTIKYRSLVDLQDYSYSRESAPSPRPKEIVITIDLPLLNSAADVDLNITDRKLTLESTKPNYKLELQLSYPVDDDKGDAKFNKAKKQLTVTLPVQPAKNPAVIHFEENQPESDDKEVMVSADEAVYETQLVKDEQSELNISEATCEAQPQESGPVQEKEEEDTHFFAGEVESYNINSLESKSKPLCLARADATLTYDINNTETFNSSEVNNTETSSSSEINNTETSSSSEINNTETSSSSEINTETSSLLDINNTEASSSSEINTETSSSSEINTETSSLLDINNTEASSSSEINNTKTSSSSEINITETSSSSEINNTETSSLLNINNTEASSSSEINNTETSSLLDINNTEASSSSEINTETSSVLDINNTEASSSSENAMNEPKKDFLPGVYIRTQETSLEPHTNNETENNQDKENVSSGSTSVQPSVITSAVKLKIANGSQLEVPVVESQMKQTESQLEEALYDVQNNPANPSNWETGKSEVEPSVISDGPDQLNSPLEKDTIKGSCRHQVMGVFSEDQNRSTELNSTRVPLNDQADNADYSKQRKTDFSVTTSAILREVNPEDGNEVIITDHTTSAAFSFQNSLWFELD